MASNRSTPTLGATLEFMRLLWALDHVLHKRSKWMARTFGITGPQRLALRIVGREPDLSAGRLADVLKVHPSTLTGILQRLERRGLMVRHVDPRDRRRVRLDLTPSGRAITTSSSGSIEDLVAGVLRRTPGARLAATTGVIRSLVDTLEADVPVGRSRRRVQV